MALIFVDGVDSYSVTADLTDKYDNNSDTGDILFNATAGRYGEGAIVADDDGQWLDKIIPLTGSAVTTDELFVSFSYKMSALSRTANQGFLALSQSGEVGGEAASSVDGVYLAFVAGLVTLYRDATILATGSNAITAGAWNRIEIRHIVDNTSGITQIKVNGELEIDFTGDNQDAGLVGINVVKFGAQHTPTQHTFDDIVIHNSAGDAPTTWLNDIRIETLRPDGAGASSDSTAVGAATRHEAVDDTGGNDGDTTYVSMATALDEDLYTIGNMSFSPASITAVATTIMCRADGTTSRTIRGKVKENVTEGNGETHAVPAGADYKHVQNFFPQNPDTTAAWAETEVNAMQIGQEVIA